MEAAALEAVGLARSSAVSRLVQQAIKRQPKSLMR
jgi:hypothetical protein